MAVQPKISTAVSYKTNYQLEPKIKFNTRLVYEILEEVVRKHCDGEKYDPTRSSTKAKTMTKEILRQVKLLEFDRYRYVVIVQIITNEHQELEMALKYFWDASRDLFVTHNYQNGSFVVVASCFGVYKD